MRFSRVLLASSCVLSSCLPLPTLPGLLPGSLTGATASASPTPSAVPSASPTPATPVPSGSPLPVVSASPAVSPTASPTAAAPAPAEIATVSGLKVSSCAEEGVIRSASGAATTVRFTNSADGRITVYWLNAQGKRVEYRKLAKGQTYDQPTYVTHPWLIANDQGQCLGIYTPTQAGTASVTVLQTTGTAAAAPVAVGPLDPVSEATITEARARAGVECLKAKGETSLATAVQGMIELYLRMSPVIGESLARQGYLAPAARVLIDKGC